jgi:hypothetical protein
MPMCVPVCVLQVEKHRIVWERQWKHVNHISLLIPFVGKGSIVLSPQLRFLEFDLLKESEIFSRILILLMRKLGHRKKWLSCGHMPDFPLKHFSPCAPRCQLSPLTIILEIAQSQLSRRVGLVSLLRSFWPTLALPVIRTCHSLLCSYGHPPLDWFPAPQWLYAMPIAELLSNVVKQGCSYVLFSPFSIAVTERHSLGNL